MKIPSSQIYPKYFGSKQNIKSSATIQSSNSHIKENLTTKKSEISTAEFTTGLLIAGVAGIAGLFMRKKIPLKEIQKTFEQHFMRKVSIGEAKVMAERYKELDKIVDNEEYAKAVFEEAKNNFGFASSKIKLTELPEFMEKQNIIGGADDAFSCLYLKKGISRDDIFDSIHHEFRHFKQKYLEFNYSPEESMMALNKRIETMSGGEVKNCWKDVEKYKEFISANIGQECSIKNIRPEDIEFCKKCIQAKAKYKDNTENFEEYWNNFLETDARNTGKGMLKLYKNICKGAIEL